MQFYDVDEVTQVAGAANADLKLAEGWKLLAVVGASHVFYVLGRKNAAREAVERAQGRVLQPGDDDD